MQKDKIKNGFPCGIGKALGILAAFVAIAMAMPAGASIVTQDLNSGLTPQDLVVKIVGEDVIVSNIQSSCANIAAGTFDNALDPIGIEAGIILSSGNIANVTGPNVQDGITTQNNFAGDTDLDLLIPGFSTQDACVLEFDFVPTGDEVTFKYAFGSDEYNEYTNTAFNDVFGFFLNGGNIALIQGTAIPVSINNVNGGNPYGTAASYPEFFRNNDLSDGGGFIDTEMDGLTTVFSATADVVPDQINHIKLAIADAGDSILDSNVFIQAGSFTSYNKGSASGLKFSDLNQNGINDNEPVLSGWPIKLTNLETGVVMEITTDANGLFNFTDLIIGTYKVEEVQQNGYLQTAPPTGSYTISITKQGENYAGLDFGNYKVVPKLGSISGVKYNDANKNGVRDYTEETLSGWEISLANETGIVNTFVTNETGSYQFNELPPGIYIVTETLQTGWFQTEPASGEHTITITESEKYENFNFGNVYDIPSANCIAGINPAGRIPPANGGQRPNGFYQLAGFSLFPDLHLYVKDLGSGKVFGPYDNGQYIKYTQNNAKPGAKEMPGGLEHINGKGDFVTYSVNSAGTVSGETLCTVPKPPK